MIQIEIVKDTFAKQSTAMAASLPPDKIHFLEAGQSLEALAYRVRDANHFSISFANRLSGYQTWLLYKGHVKIDGNSHAPKFNPPLKVRYFSQRDNIEQWYRTCNTSCCAMVAEFIKPGSCRGSDDWYFRNCVKPEGDTTDHGAQTRALRRLGIQSRFHYDLTYADLDRQLQRNRPVVIGVLHKGTISSPKGGHMIVVIGRYEHGYICHDPWGKGFGNYHDKNGESVQYPITSLDSRWLVDGPMSGWGRIFD